MKRTILTPASGRDPESAPEWWDEFPSTHPVAAAFPAIVICSCGGDLQVRERQYNRSPIYCLSCRGTFTDACLRPAALVITALRESLEMKQ